MSSAAPAITPARNVRLRQIALPTEHGGWGFLLEPLVAGLAISFSSGAPWIAVLTIGAFLLRRPLKVIFVDRLGMKNPARARAAVAFALLYATIFAVGLSLTLITVGPRPLLPFIFVLPFAIIQIYADVCRQSRHLSPEITGAIAISASIAVMALADGAAWITAVALWTIFVARLIPSILYVRERLRLEKGKDFSRITPIAAHFAALLIIVILAYNGLSPYLTVFAMIMLLYRSVSGLSPGRKKMRAMQIGVWEVIYGALTVLSVVIGHYTGL